MLNNGFQFNSRLAYYLENYIKLRKSEGFKFNFQTRILLNLDVYLYDYDLDITDLSNETMAEWKSLRSSEGPVHCRSRNIILNQFIDYLGSLGFRIHVSRLPIKLPKPLPYLLSDSETVSLIKAADSYKTRNSGLTNFDTERIKFERIALEYKVILRLILSCGLRNNEACTLQTKDIEWEQSYFLIRSSKGDKDRLVYMTESMATLLKDYLNYLKVHYEVESKWVFPGKNTHNPLPKSTLDNKFSLFWQTASNGNTIAKHPTVHSLRHKQVINKLDQWANEGKDIDTLMPYLSAYLGHSDRSHTYYYYHQLKESLNIVRDKDLKSTQIIPEADENEEK